MPIIGELLRVSDRVTRFSPDDPKERRPYVVVRTLGRRVRVVPQSTRSDRGVYVPDDVVNGLEPGWFVPWSTTISIAHALRCPAIGQLPQHYLNEVIAQTRGSK